MNRIKKGLLATSLLSLSQFSTAGLLSIEINNVGGLSETQSAVFSDASIAWSDLLTGIQSSFDLLISIDASGTYIDGINGTLGRAGPTDAIVDSTLGFAYASKGVMEFDTADLDNMESNGSLFDVILHELSHVIGFGTLWNTDSFGGVFAGTQSLYEKDSGQYLGAYALAEYQSEFDEDALYVPVELDGGEGTANGHWDETWAGGSSDILTGYYDVGSTLSRTSIASFADMGYLTTVTHPINIDTVEVSAPATLGLFSLGLFLVFRRKSKED
jgi:hypothetical protein